MTQQINDISIKALSESLNGISHVRATDDFFFASMGFVPSEYIYTEPCKFNGYVVIYCSRGSLYVNLNLRRYKMAKGMFVIYIPGTIISFDVPEGVALEDISISLAAASPSLVADLQLEISKIYDDSLHALVDPCFSLTEEESKMGNDFFKLIHSIEISDLPNKEDVLSKIFKAFYATAIGIMTKGLNKHESQNDVNVRSKRVFESFLKLVTEHHNEERYLEYYADKLCLTPKYLSSTVKAVSGKSAPDWISSFVIVEAKNLLKFSNMDVKEIAFKLNFNAPSVFCRFFKAETGMTPTEYRNK